jgi:predicted enzyme related to lactoylglutathione lyase
VSARLAPLWSALVPARPQLIEFPADDPDRARRFWSGLLESELRDRDGTEGEGWQTGSEPAVGVHARGRGPGDSAALPYFAVPDLPAAIARVTELGGSVVHPGRRWAICRDSEGSPFGLAAQEPPGGADDRL